MVMCPMIEMCGPVARVGLFFVNTAKSLQSHASRMTRERTLPGRRIIVSAPANSASRTSSRLSSTPGSMTLAPFLDRVADFADQPFARGQAGFDAS